MLKKIILVSFVLMLFIQLIFAYNLVVRPSWDFGVNFNTAINLANGNYELGRYYWGNYPNNIGATVFLGVLFKPLIYFTQNANYFLLYGIIINTIMILIAQASLVWLVFRKKGLKIAAFVSIFILFITPFYCYVPIVYTDTLSMLFPILAILLLDIYDESSWDKKYIWLIIMSFIITFGIIIKTNVIITFVAIVIYFIMKYKLIESIKQITLVLAVFIIVMASYKGIAQKLIPIPYDEAGFPATHWIMMGMTGNGWYNYEDAVFTDTIYQEKGKNGAKEANLKVIKERLTNYGLYGYLKFVNHKVNSNWSDGTFYAPAKLRIEPFKDTKLHSYIIGENNKYYVYISQAMYIILLCGMVLSAIKNFKSKVNIYTLSCIAMFGTLLFSIIWEARSRYIVLMIPIMILLCIDGLQVLDKPLSLVKLKRVKIVRNKN